MLRCTDGDGVRTRSATFICLPPCSENQRRHRSEDPLSCVRCGAPCHAPPTAAAASASVRKTYAATCRPVWNDACQQLCASHPPFFDERPVSEKIDGEVL